MSIRVPVRYRFQAPLSKVTAAYQTKMLQRGSSSSGNTGVRVEVVEVGATTSTYRVVRTMPVWYRLLGGRAETEYVETLTLEDGKMTTSAKQDLPFGGRAETKVVFVRDGSETVVFGTVSASDLPKSAQTIVKKVFRSFVQKTFREERSVENGLLSNCPPIL